VSKSKIHLLNLLPRAEARIVLGDIPKHRLETLQLCDDLWRDPMIERRERRFQAALEFRVKGRHECKATRSNGGNERAMRSRLGTRFEPTVMFASACAMHACYITLGKIKQL